MHDATHQVCIIVWYASRRGGGFNARPSSLRKERGKSGNKAGNIPWWNGYASCSYDQSTETTCSTYTRSIISRPIASSVWNPKTSR
jgi:hypothetical protein